MKKIITTAISTITALNFIFTASGLTVLGAEKNSDVEIKFNLGQNDLYINSEVVTVPAPFSMGQGTTMVPLRVITESFGATVDWNATEKKITINYNDSQIVMYINSKTAEVNGNIIAMAEAPIINDGTTMVPLRFISEEFGAVVGYDETTKGISVKKSASLNSNATSSSIDVNELLNVTDTSYVGDSNFKWYMKNSPTFSLRDRNFDGSELVYVDDKGLNEIQIDIFNNIPKGYTIDEAIAVEKSDLGDKTLVTQKQSEKDGANCFEISYKTKTNNIYTKIYLKDNILYHFSAYIDNESEKQDMDLALDLFNSLTLGYISDGSISDLSSIGDSGSRKFEQTKLKISMNLPASWSQYNENGNKINSFYFHDQYNYGDEKEPSKIIIKMFSREEGLSLSDWAKRDAENAKVRYNSKYYTQQFTSGKIGDYNYSGYDETIKFNDGTEIKNKAFYIFGKEYKYQINVIMSSDDYKDKQKFDEIMNAVNSFKFESPDVDEVGLLTENYEYYKDEDSKTKEITDKDSGISAKIPVSWNSTDSGNSYMSDAGLMLSFSSIKGNNLSLAGMEYSIKNDGMKIIEKKDMTARVAGQTASYIKYSYEDDDEDTIITEIYAFINKDKIVFAIFNYEDITNGERNKSLVKNVVSSISIN